ncbi:retinol dehydrogenase 12-like isoform X2 [Bacillus rossius redtenbacheri]|uniref:retinol dehydrogenase 12-like isoform X2 n=1 Tax=Bacillus rossius redtenbacheri TaxID=93214 RepID=UPI002FDC8346
MVTVVLYVIFPVVIVAAGLIRKWQEKQWGKCKSQSSLQDKVFIVTGANSGIGKETARGLVKRKARVIMACRDLSSARNAIEDIRHETSSGELIPIHLDLSSLMSVREFVSEVLKEFPKIHVLINNAGVYIPVEKNCKTKEGFEIHFGVNHLGHFLLTNLLIPRLRESAPARWNMKPGGALQGRDGVVHAARARQDRAGRSPGREGLPGGGRAPQPGLLQLQAGQRAVHAGAGQASAGLRGGRPRALPRLHLHRPVPPHPRAVVPLRPGRAGSPVRLEDRSAGR